MKNLLFLLVSLALMLPCVASANSGTMGGHGADLVPMKSTDVSMVSEDILLTLHDDRQWYIEADYVFSNHSDREQALQFGFPEYRCEDEEMMECPEDSVFHFEDMVTFVRGVAVSHRKGTLTSGHEWAPKLGTVWLFDVTFAPRETVKIRHTYHLPSTTGSDGSLSTRYVTRTGSLWAGPIGSARFRVRVPVRAIEFTGPAHLPEPTVQKLEIDGRRLAELTWEIRDFAPEADLDFSFRLREYAALINYLDAPPLLPADATTRAGLPPSERCDAFAEVWDCGWENTHSGTKRDNEAAAALKKGINSPAVCVAMVYALYGKRFDDDRLNKLFYGPDGFKPGPWPHGFLKPNPDFDPAWLEEDDLETLVLFKRFLSPEPAADTPPAASLPGNKRGCAVVGSLPDSSCDELIALAFALSLLIIRRMPRRPLC